VTVTTAVRERLADLYAAYANCLDDGRFGEWPEFFTEDAWYRIVPRENYDQGLPLSTLSLKGKAMMKDRIYGIESTIFHAPYYQRHILGPLQISADADGGFDVRCNFLVVRTKRDMMAEIFSVGYYLDKVKMDEISISFTSKICVFDNDLIPNSLIYPI